MFILTAHLLVTLAELGRPGGLRAVAAESLAVKHQLLIMKRSRQRAPNLTSTDRLTLGVCALFASRERLSKMAVILKPSALLRFHHALVKREYYLLYNSRKRHRPGPKGPSKDLIDAVVEMKRRNPRFGCRKIAEQISSAFGIEINKDVVRRIFIRYCIPVWGELLISPESAIRHTPGHPIGRTPYSENPDLVDDALQPGQTTLLIGSGISSPRSGLPAHQQRHRHRFDRPISIVVRSVLGELHHEYDAVARAV